MRKRWFLVCFVLTVLGTPDQLNAQFTEAHHYDNTPVGLNQLELSYAYTRANASIDTSLVVAGAQLNLNQGTLVHRLVWVDASVPIAGLGGSVTGTNISGSVSGAGDSSYEVAALLKGGPALTVEEFSKYEQTTTVGMSLIVTAPTGLYNPNKVLNLGSDRWSFKPEIALSHPFGPERKWEFDAYANASFYTDNTSYHGAEILRQEALPGVEGHISYSFIESLWASFDARYSFRGDTVVNGVSQNNAQKNLILGSEVNFSINSRNSLVLEFAKAVVHENGPSATGFAVKYNYTWGKGYR